MKSSLLMVAYQCGPNMGSVSQIGWEWYQRMAKRRPITLITHSRNRAALETAGAPLPDSHIEYIDTEWLAGPLYRTASRLFPGKEHAIFLLSSLDYYLFDFLALRRARQRQAQGQHWGVVHVPTPVSSAAGTRLHNLGLPLVRGPLNCGLGNPAGFGDVLQQESQWLNQGRKLGQWIAARLEKTSQRQITLTATAATRSAIPKQQQQMPMLENGIDHLNFTPSLVPHRRPTEPLNILFVGRMLPVKGVNFLLQAAARLIKQGYPIELTLVGEGGKRLDWQALSVALGIAQFCHFTGNLPLAQIPDLMRQCHVFCLPSVRESGGAVILEAMACARPVIAYRFGGPAELVTPDTGVLLDANSPSELIEALYHCLLDCHQNPERWAQRGAAAAKLLHQPHPMGFDWEYKMDLAEQLYEQMQLNEVLPSCHNARTLHA
ncbi:glycosyltransferase [Chitinibacter bivalviorum]|uniref:Glycosyltransferase n=1 Tax=Chitinibacter bivalviorum TaxID=2739434 RepID=A0A7H9BHN8_9NEIS|nr:glycosyltransferase [Chitinibacter bivalviorum]QLG87786.1 glycosyltransferase [Chitinibacter bivalviorum]